MSYSLNSETFKSNNEDDDLSNEPLTNLLEVEVVPMIYLESLKTLPTEY